MGSDRHVERWILGGRQALERSAGRRCARVPRDGYKLIVYPKARKGRLYHIAKDPFEMVDLLEQGKGRKQAEKLLAELRRLAAEMGDELSLKDAWIE